MILILGRKSKLSEDMYQGAKRWAITRYTLYRSDTHNIWGKIATQRKERRRVPADWPGKVPLSTDAGAAASRVASDFVGISMGASAKSRWPNHCLVACQASP